MTILLGPIMYEHHRFPEEERESPWNSTDYHKKASEHVMNSPDMIHPLRAR